MVLRVSHGKKKKEIQSSRLVVVVIISYNVSVEVENSLGLFFWSRIIKSKILAMKFYFFQPHNVESQRIKSRGIPNGLEADGSYRTM